MAENGLKNLLSSRENLSHKRGWRCPGETQLAAYADGRLEGPARKSVETHLADCRFCLDTISFLVQSAEWSGAANVPPWLLARAKSLAAEGTGVVAPQRWHWAAIAATACLVLATVLFIVFQSRQPETLRSSESPLLAQQKQPEEEAVPLQQTPPSIINQNSVTPTDSTPHPRKTLPKPRPAQMPAPAIRSAEANDLAPKLLSPRDGAALKREDLEFRWQAANDALFYEVVLMTESGDLVFEKKTEATHLRISADVSLAAGTKYFVWVRAYLREGKTAKSGVVTFRTMD